MQIAKEPTVKWSQTLWFFTPMSSVCLLSVEIHEPKNKFNQRSENMQKPRKAVKQEKKKKKITVWSLRKVKGFQYPFHDHR